MWSSESTSFPVSINWYNNLLLDNFDHGNVWAVLFGVIMRYRYRTKHINQSQNTLTKYTDNTVKCMCKKNACNGKFWNMQTGRYETKVQLAYQIVLDTSCGINIVEA